MKKIAIITTGLSKIFDGAKCGGGEILLENLILELANMPDVSLFVFTPDNKDFVQKIKEKFPNINFAFYNQSPFSYSYIDEFKKLLQKEVFDKVINYNMVIPYETTMLQSHSYIHKLNKVFILFKPFKKFILRHKIRIQKLSFERAVEDSDYIAVSKIIKEDYCKNFNIPSNKINVIYPGVKLGDFKEIIKKDVPTFGIVANSSINKGGHYLLAALGLLKLLNKKFKIVVIAPKFKKDLLMQSIINLFGMKKDTIVLPFQTDMTDFYNSIDILVLPSINEAFGLVTLEAMEKGKPCLISSFAGSSEVINRNNGFIFNRNSFYDFIKNLFKIIKLYNEDFENFKEISNAARETAQKYTWREFAKKVID